MKQTQMFFVLLTLACATAGAQAEPSGVLKNVKFNVNSDQLKPGSAAILDQAVEAIKNQFPDARIELAGHSDETGPEEYNLDLSQRRAQAVLNYLVNHGIEADRLLVKGYGADRPVADNESERGRSQNRRVEVRFVQEPGPGDFH